MLLLKLRSSRLLQVLPVLSHPHHQVKHRRPLQVLAQHRHLLPEAHLVRVRVDTMPYVENPQNLSRDANPVAGSTSTRHVSINEFRQKSWLVIRS